eukprot:TRINITY_DN23615_c0_g1_i1.p1 TRINITY_DN23615_c0_g1~~TRINITY_DN23615_c0_g1_i1.p1  ORF type:complete len:259 (+),score=59.23 TRINITY_DN23615_c0_g1_i1:22-777(+)
MSVELDDTINYTGRVSEDSVTMPYAETEVDIGRERKLFKRALIICIMAFIITITSAFTGLAVGVINHSSAFLAFGCDALVDILAGSFIIWRFSGKMDTVKQVHHIEQKENRASVGIAFALVLIAVVTAIQAIVHLSGRDPPNNDTLLFIVSGVLGGLLLIVSLIKFWIAYKLKSLALKESGITNISGFFLSIGVIVANGAFLADTKVWFLDASFALIISLLLASFGVHTIVTKRNYFWWKSQFWCPKEEDD